MMKRCLILSPLFSVLLLTARLSFAVEINYKALYERAAPMVVLIYGTDSSGKGTIGSGSIIDSKGLILTNTHVVTANRSTKKNLRISLKPPEVSGDIGIDTRHSRHKGVILALNSELDLALVQLTDPPPYLNPLPLSDLRNIGIGEPAIAIGHPSGGAPWSMTTGRISASFTNYKGKEGYDVFQMDTDINPGNSGGPLLDGSGAIIGINTFVKRRHSSGMTLAGLNFAVKSTTAVRWINSVIDRVPGVSEIAFSSSSDKLKPEDPASKIENAKPSNFNQNPPRSFVKRGKTPRMSDFKERRRNYPNEYESSLPSGTELGGPSLSEFFSRQNSEFENFIRRQEQEFNDFFND